MSKYLLLFLSFTALVFINENLIAKNMSAPKNNKVIIYTKDYCPYCVKAKMLLKNKKITFEEIDVTNNEDAWSDMMKKSNNRQTVPQIFIGDIHVGGCDDLHKLEADGKLDLLLNA
jgi:glutaredoxin 3